MSDWPSGYSSISLDGLDTESFRLRALRWEDREPIREWRNEQMEILRQAAPLTAEAQDRYYREVIAPQLSQEQPPQVLVALETDMGLIGYGGLVHISWTDRRAEVSFITAGDRQDEMVFRADLGAFLMAMTALAERLGLHRLTTECYEFRSTFIEELERAGYVREGRLREHVWMGDRYIDSLIHGLLLPTPDIRR